jgi:hypothetical protein
MKPILCLAALGAAILVWAQQTPQKKYRTSPAGYSDTPVIPGQKWKVHDIDRPRPRMVTPGANPGDAPSDAIVLFNGKDLAAWSERGKGPNRNKFVDASWTLRDGYMEVRRGSGDLATKEKFGDVQLHIEWASPVEIDGDSQWRGNSGVILMERYEIQVLDSFQNKTYADGQAGALYGQWAPLVNASRKPGEWQTYDIVFEAPKFEGETVAKPAMATVFHNGVLLHNRQAFTGQMAHRVNVPYKAHEPEERLMLQNHDTLVRYRNIWVRRLKGYDQPE